MTENDYLYIAISLSVLFALGLTALLIFQNRKILALKNLKIMADTKEEPTQFHAINPAPIFLAKAPPEADNGAHQWTAEWRGNQDVDPCAEAEVYIAYGRTAQAIEILKEAIERNNNPYAHLLIIELYKEDLKNKPELGELIATHQQAIKDSGKEDVITKNAQREALAVGRLWHPAENNNGGGGTQSHTTKLWVHLLVNGETVGGYNKITPKQLEIEIPENWPSPSASVALQAWLNNELKNEKYAVVQVFVLDQK